jgi:MGT family glycosyltransferase
MRFLFVLWDGGGNVPPQLAVARRLVARRHEVRILGPQVLKQRIEAAGGTFVPYSRVPEHDSTTPEKDLLQDWAARTPLGASARVRDRLMAGPALAFAQDVLGALDTYPADIVVTDYLLLGAFLGAERAGLPTAALIHHIYPLPDPAIPPFGMGFQPAHGVAGRLRDAIFRRAFVRFYDGALPRLNEARMALGLAPLASVFQLFARVDRVLVLSSRSFDFPAAALPGNVRYVGPQLDAPQPATSWEGPWRADDPRPLVVASFSTTVQRQKDVLQRVITALGELPVRALVTVGPAVDPASYQEPRNVVVRSFVPHQQVFPRADLVITHGGHGTVLTALACGVPVLCLPMGRDQADVAARAVWRGAGLSLSPRSKPDAVRQAVQRMLDEPHFREGARRVAEGMARADGESSAVEELEALSAPLEAQRLSLTAS